MVEGPVRKGEKQWQRWHCLRRRDIRSVGKSVFNANGQRAISVWVYVRCTLHAWLPDALPRVSAESRKVTGCMCSPIRIYRQYLRIRVFADREFMHT